jgi:mono/diheme cytochrome c family protein
LAIQFVLELISGLILAFSYHSTEPYESAKALHGLPSQFFQAFHYWQSALLIIESLLLLLLLLWSGTFKAANRVLYYSGLLTFASSLGFQISGNLLPFDRHGVQTAVIEASIGARAPLIGDKISELSLGGAQFSMKTVQAWYAIHWSLTALAIVALILWFTALSSNRKLVRIVASLLVSLAPVVLALTIRSPLGSKATEADYSSFADRASWYTWPLHGALVMFSRLNPSLGWIGAMLIPGLFGCAWLGLPWLKTKWTLHAGKVVAGLFVAFFGVAAFGFGGSFDPLTGTRDPAQDLKSALTGKLPAIDTRLAQQGKEIFNKVGCAGCHGLDGANGKAGPTLTQAYVRHPDSAYYMKYVKNPAAVDPNSTMPSFPDLNQNQLATIAEYLRDPKKP